MDMKNEKPLVEILFIFYSLILAGFWVLRAAQESVAPFMVLLHVGLVFLLRELTRIGSESPLPLRILRRLFPFTLWALAWSEIGWLYRLTQPVVQDQGVKAVDLALFGVHWNENLSSLISWAWVQDVMGFSYLSYYLLILGPPLVLALKRKEDKLAHHTLGLMSTYLGCFLFYLAMPVLGPRDLAQSIGESAAVIGGQFGPVIQAFFSAGDSPGTAFPSSHCAGSVASALLVRHHFGPKAGRLALVWAGFIVVSTVYTNNHYPVDAVAGVILAVLTLRIAMSFTVASKDGKSWLSRGGQSVEKGGIS